MWHCVIAYLFINTHIMYINNINIPTENPVTQFYMFWFKYMSIPNIFGITVGRVVFLWITVIFLQIIAHWKSNWRSWGCKMN